MLTTTLPLLFLLSLLGLTPSIIAAPSRTTTRTDSNRPTPTRTPNAISPSPTSTSSFTGVDHCALKDANNPGPCAPFTCPAVASRKRTLRRQSATARDLAIAMLETGCAMDADAYPVGDVNADGSCCKVGDAANYGLFKNNWGSIRRNCREFAGLGEGDGGRVGTGLNNNDTLAITCQHEQISRLGIAGFYKAQRGVGNGDDYATAITYIENYFNQGHLEDENVVTYYLGRV